MKKKLFMILLMGVTTFLFAQTIAPKKCNTCGKPLAQCQYKGKHPLSHPDKSNKNNIVPQGDITIITGTEDVDVLIDGRSIGKTPFTGKFNLGNYIVILKKKGYYSIKEQITVEAGKEYLIARSLEKIKGISGFHSGHEWVDLGLPSDVKWATCNIGANKPSEEGYYYAWGECTTKFPFRWNNYKYIEKYEGEKNSSDGKTFKKYHSGNVLEKVDDTACQNWGGNWRMPTKKEYKELVENCTWKSVVSDGKWGLQATSKINGNILFFTATCFYDEACSVRRTPEDFHYNYSGGSFGGDYWTSTACGGASAETFFFDNNGPRDMYGSFRYVGLLIRPVVEL